MDWRLCFVCVYYVFWWFNRCGVVEWCFSLFEEGWEDVNVVDYVWVVYFLSRGVWFVDQEGQLNISIVEGCFGIDEWWIIVVVEDYECGFGQVLLFESFYD